MRGFLSGIVMFAATLLVARPVRAQEGTKVSGVVFDSLTMGPLRGAGVQIADATGKSWSKTVETDPGGRFEFTGVPVGTYLIGYFHPRLDSLALSATALRVDIRNAAPVTVRLATSSARTIARAVCGTSTIRDSTGLFMGFLRSADSPMPRAHGTLSVRWSEVVIEKKSIRRNVQGVEASSGATGLFAVCGVPLGAALLLRAWSDADSSGLFEVTVPPTGFLHRDVFVGKLSHVAVPSQDSSPGSELLRGSARLRGRVTSVNKRPVANARITVWATGVEATTADDGTFQLGGLPAGTHTLDVRAIGFMPTQQPVDIVDGTPGGTEVGLTSLGIMLDTVRVTTSRVYTSRRQADFERRVRTGLGHYILEDEIERRKPFYLTDLLRTIPGVRIAPGTSGNRVVMRDGARDCAPDIFIDGAHVYNDPNFPIDFLAPVSEVRAMEVYTRSLSTPGIFSSMGRCGALVIWTGPRKKY